MIPDHYATLGVTPTSPDAAIRAAYLELMRRYHPDRNPSAATATRVSAITDAYSVLGVPERRARYDDQRARLRAMQASTVPADRREMRMGPWLAAAFGVVAIAVALPFLIPPPLTPPELPAQVAEVKQARAMAPPEQAEPAPGPNMAALCSSQFASGLIKRELFRRAARARGSDAAAFDRLAGHSVARLDSPAVAQASEGGGTVDCTAFVAVDLPAGIAAQGGLRTLTGTVGYSLQTAARTIRLTDAGPFVELLATLGPVRIAAIETLDRPALPADARADEPAAAPVRRVASPAPSPPPPAARVEPQRVASRQDPSFSCQFAKSRAQLSICNSASLAALDRETASLYGRSLGGAEASTRALLLQSNGRFLARRDNCSSESCVHGAYVARIREIKDIAAGQ